MNSPTSKEFIQRLGQKHNLTSAQVTDIIKSQFRFVVKVMGEGDYGKNNFKNIFLRGFGRFVVTPFTHNKIAKRTGIEYEGNKVIADEDIIFIDDSHGANNTSE